MRTRFLALALTALIAVGCSDQPLPTAAPTDAGSGFTPSLSIQSQFGQHDVSDQYLVLLKGKGVPSVFSDEVARLGGTVLFSHPIGFAVVNGLSDVAATTLGRNRHVNEIQQDELFDLDPMYDEASITAVTATPASSTDPTTAVVFNRQWNMRAIAADAAWASGRLGSSAVTVAILDTGIDYLHPDLAGRVDLSRSVSFVDFDDFLVGLFFPTRHLITDLNFHGTHVSSIAASNSIFFAGVTTQTTLIGVKVCDVNGSCPFSGVISGVLHAADNG
ncbi:MAG: S8 family serine peptidase, partial [Gemmatimonadales bacterium]|nr:S8 family serine peptidase [Gemmatimonadales bacterium]